MEEMMKWNIFYKLEELPRDRFILIRWKEGQEFDRKPFSIIAYAKSLQGFHTYWPDDACGFPQSCLEKGICTNFMAMSLHRNILMYFILPISTISYDQPERLSEKTLDKSDAIV